MTRSELDRLLEKTVAEALGVPLPQRVRRATSRKRRDPAPVTARRAADRHLQPA